MLMPLTLNAFGGVNHLKIKTHKKCIKIVAYYHYFVYMPNDI